MLNNPLDNRSLYNWYDWGMEMLQPYSDYCLTLSKRCKRISDTMNLPITIPYFSDLQNEIIKTFMQSGVKYYRGLTGYCYVSHMITNIYERPKFNITDVKVEDSYYDVDEEIVDRKSFCNLLRFTKRGISTDY